MQAAIGRRQHPVLRHRDAVHVGGHQPGIGALPVPAAVVAAEDAADLDRRPQRLAREQDLRDARRAAVDVGKFGDTRYVELAPARAAIVGCEERCGSAAGEEARRIFGILRDRPDIAHRRLEQRPARRALVPAVHTLIGARVHAFGQLRMAAERPDARLEIEAGVAVGMHPRFAEIIAEPRGVARGPGVNTDVLLHRSAIIQRMRALFAPLGLLVCSAVSAQSFPPRPLHIVIGFPPGGGIDTVARLLGPKMSESLGQPVVIDNRPGGGGVLGTDLVAKAAPDGHTLFFGTMGNLAVNPQFLANLPFNMERDLAPVTQVVSTWFLLYPHPAVPAKAVGELIPYPPANPGKINFCSSGNGGPPPLPAELFASMARIQLVHRPAKGSAPCVTDLIGGQGQLTFEAGTIGLQHVQSGKPRALAPTPAKRLPMAADLPTIAETLPGYEVDNWYGMVAPARTPRAAIQRIRDEVVKAMAIPEIRERLLGLGQVPVGSTPEKFGPFMKSEGTKWLKVIREANITPG